MQKRAWLIAILLVVFGAVNIVGTYPRLSHTSDEAPHVATGMQWWNQHQYTYEPLHPPLARVMAASLLYFAGKDQSVTDPNQNFWYQGSDILHSHGTYKLNLILLRLGVLPFYLLSCALVYGWSRQLFGVESALVSLGVYVTLPTLAAHAGLATTDMGNATMVMAAIMASLHWLKKPDFLSSVLAGAVLALMVATKLSAVFYWPVAMMMILITNYAVRYAGLASAQVFTIRLAHIGWSVVVCAVLLFVLGAMYFFSYDALIRGMTDLLNKNKYGHATWLFHPLNNVGVWYYFPVVYFFKTPIAFLCSTILAGARVMRSVINGQHNVERLFPFVAALAIFAMSMPSNINIGVRHVLGVYPLLAVPAGYGLLWLWQQKKLACKPALQVLLVLLLWVQTADFFRAFPDRLAYYNQIGRWITSDQPERISFDSDVDWGQGFLFLADTIKKRDIKELYTCFWLGGSIRRMDETLKLSPKGCPNGKISGWIAMGRVEKLQYPQKYEWLDAYQPVENVGNTIWLYHID